MEDKLFDEIMEIHNNKRNFNLLVEDFKVGRIIPFIGAGFSCPQFPSWEQLIRNHSKTYGIEDEINRAISSGNLEKAASLLENAMGRLEFKDYFLETFDKEKIGAFTDNQLWLPKLFRSGIITTNYDHLLETLYKEQLEFEFELLLPRYKEDEAAIDRVIRRDKPYLIKLHGDVARYEHCILTEEQYMEIYTGKSEYEKMLGRIFENKMILFLGCSLISDRTLTLLKHLNHDRDIYHYAIVPLPEATRNLKQPDQPYLYSSEETRTYKEELLKRIQQLSSLSIRPIFYPYEQYQMISVLFEKLAQTGFDLHDKKAVPEKRVLPDGLHVISAEDVQKKQSLTEEEIQHCESLYYQINSNWDCMYTIICNDKEIRDETLIGLATEMIDKGQSLIIAGNGGQGKTSLMMRLAVNLAVGTNAVSIIWISMDIVSPAHIENFWSALETGKNYVICVDSPFSNMNMLKKLQSTFPMEQRKNVRFIFSERIQRIEELLEEEAFFTGWIEPVSAICCMGNAKEKEVFKILERHNIKPYYYELKKDWKHSVIKRTLTVTYGGSMTEKTVDEMEKTLPASIHSIAEQVIQIFFMIDKKYPTVSGINLDWKEWKEHLRKWFHNTSIDEYYYEPIAACSVFSLDLDLDTYAKMMHLPEEIWNKMNYMVGEHIEPVRYNKERNTIQPKHDIYADMFFYSHPKADLVRCLIRYINVTKNTQEIFDQVLRKGKIFRKTILTWGKKLDYQPLIDHIKRIGYAPENKSRLILAGLWNCSSLEEQVCYIQKNLSDNIFEELTDNESGKAFVEIGIIYGKAKKYQLAEKIFCKALEIDASDLPAYNELGRLYVEQGRYEEAEGVFRKALEIDAGDLPIYNELGRLYAKQGKYKEAEEVFRKAMEKGNLPSYNELGCLYEKQERYEKAEEVFRKALEIDTDNLPVYNELGRLYVKQGKYEEAEEVFCKALEKGSLPSYNELGCLYVKQRKYEEAEEVFRKAVEKDHLPSYNELGRLYVKQGRNKEAEEVFCKALEIDADNLPVYNELGRLCEKQGRYEEAEEVFRKAMEKGSLPSYNELGCLYVKQGRDKEAEEVFCKALEIDTDNLPVYNELGRLYVKQGRYEEAEDAFCKALEIDADDLLIYNELGRLYVKQGRYEEAEEVFRKAMEKGNLPSYNELGRLYVKQGRDKEAEEVFCKALEIDADNLPVYNELGRLCEKQGRYEEAEDAFCKALEIDADDLLIYNELGRLYVKQGRYGEAEEVFRKAMEKGNLPSYNELGRLYMKQGKYEEAENVFCEALEKSLGKDSHILASLIKLYSKTSNCKKADDLIKRYTNKTTAYYDSFCKDCYIYIKNVKGLKEAIKYKKQVQRFNSKFKL